MPTTSVYGIPYPAVSDQPHGPTQIQAAVEEIETELVRIDGAATSDANRLTALEALQAGLDARIIGGIRRTTDDGNTTGTTEKVGLTAPALNLEANKTYLVAFYARAGGGTNDDTFGFRIREDSVSGTAVGSRIGGTKVLITGDPTLEIVHGFYITTSAVPNKVFVGTIQRLTGAGVGNIRTGAYLTVTRIGSDTLLTTV